MIPLLTQLILHQVRPSPERVLAVPEPPRPHGPIDAGAHPRSLLLVSSTDPATTAWWPEPLAHALIEVLIPLAQRRVLDRAAQEEVHEHGSHYHNASATTGLRLRAAIDPVASE